jgi:hypothetical protein
MPVTFNERLIAHLTLLSGLSISAVAVYYSVAGLTTIFAAAAVPIIIMGIVLELSKLIATVWLKQNWNIAPWSVRSYLLTAIITLMLITSMGIFGFLSKAHSDQALISGDVQSKLAIYDEKIQTAKENIDANRKALKQMDEAVDQTMGRSTTEVGASKAVQIRRSQQAERSRIAQDIEAEQKKINQLMEERAPIAVEVRKVEAEVGPIKYIAAFVYSDTDKTVLEKAVTWVIILIVVVFDPLAVILLISSQISFQNFRKRDIEWDPEYSDYDADYQPDVKEPQESITSVSEQTTVTTHSSILEQHPYLTKKFKHFENLTPIVYRRDEEDKDWQRWVENAEIPDVDRPGDYLLEEKQTNYGYSGYVQNEEQSQSNLWKRITQDEYLDSINRRKE